MDPKDEIKDKIDLQELIGESVPLKPAGTHSFKGLCPFHGEKTPSFHVSPDKQIWHCFGCGEGGDCFSFVMKMEGMTFPESLMHLGKRVGVEVQRFSSAEGNKKQRLLAMHELAEKFYRKVLQESPKAKAAREYMQGRGIPNELMERFGIGFALDEWDALSELMRKRGYSEGEMVEAGLSMRRKSGRGVIDRFRGRIMIPLRDHHGATVGFTGRILLKQTPPNPPLARGGSQDGPKYMNSPETPIYHKSRLVFGLDLAKTAARQEEAIIIVEGNLDVVASHKADVEHVVASSGTALTKDQLERLKRYTDTIIFAFDADAAGFKAAKKGMGLARELGFDIRAAILPTSVKDPDELVQKDPDAWRALIQSSVPIMEFLIAHVTRGKDLSGIDDKRSVAKELLPVLREMQSVVEREHWLQRVADLLKTDVGVLRSSVTPKEQEKQRSAIVPTISDVNKQNKEEQSFELLFGYLLIKKDEEILKKLESVLPSSKLWIILYNLLKDAYALTSNSVQKSLFLRLREKTEAHSQADQLVSMLDKASLVADQTFQDLSQAQVLEQLEHLFATLSRGADKRQRAELARKLRQAEAAGDTEAVERLMKQLT